jgi:hypothetical protein
MGADFLLIILQFRYRCEIINNAALLSVTLQFCCC